MNFIKRIYYRCRTKRRLREVKTGKRRSSPIYEPVTLDDLIGNEPEYNPICTCNTPDMKCLASCPLEVERLRLNY